MKNYAKYLGIDPSEVAEEFNDFLFEHTSKISIEDILEAKKKIEEKEEKKIKSPYTKEYKEKINFKPFIYWICIILGIILLGLLIKSIVHKEPVKKQVLSGYFEEEVYEFTY